MEQLVAAVGQLGRLPRRGDDVPRGLVDWVKNQRRRSSLTAEQRARLEELGGWSWEPREDHFDARVDELYVFHRQHGRGPSRVAAAETERSLAEWLRRQERASHAGRLPYARRGVLSWVLGGGEPSRWNSRIETDH